MREIKRVAVLGSGVMGGAIAGLVASCGVPCLMLDIVPPALPEKDKGNKDKRNAFAAASKAALLKTRPSPIFTKSALDLIEIGNFDDDFEKIAECDWLCEVVKEDLSIKQAVFAKVSKVRKPGSIISTNTSGIPVGQMVGVMDDDMRRNFLGTHFFNPPRYLKLLELIPGPETLPEVMRTMADFGENVLGKGIVYAKDTPNFVANRILIFSMMYIMHEMLKDKLTFEEVDALTGPVAGHASSATFRTGDLVGMDTFVHVVGNVYNGCPDDEQRAMLVPPDFVTKMIEKGYLGEKSGSGFYKRTNDRDEKGKRIILSLDPATMDYVPQVKPRFDCIGAAKAAATLEEKVRLLHTGEDKGSVFAWKLFSNTAIYAANRIPEIADDIVNIDNSVKWGFAWEIGIFETWDALGFEYVCDRMTADGHTLPPIVKAMQSVGAKSFYKANAHGHRFYFDVGSKSYKPESMSPNILLLSELGSNGSVVKRNDDASLIDLGDGILDCEFHCKLNVVGPDLVAMIQEGARLVNEGQFEGMVLGNQGPHFSAGANLMMILGFMMNDDWESIRKIIQGFQQANMSMRFCRGPVVSTPHHYTFGGGLEMAQHAARAVIAGETYGGLVEAGVGVIPAGGGTKEMLRRAMSYVPDTVPDNDPFPYVRRAFESIAMAKVSFSGAELVELGYLSENDVLCPSFEQQVKRAKDVCLGLLKEGYKAPRPAKLTVLGDSARAAFHAALYNMQVAGYASEHDVAVAKQVAYILTGGDHPAGSKITEQDALDMECESFLTLCGTEKTRARIQHMLMTNKPLRN